MIEDNAGLECFIPKGVLLSLSLQYDIILAGSNPAVFVFMIVVLSQHSIRKRPDVHAGRGDA